MTSTTRKVGDIVKVNSPKWPGLWKIEKINAVNWKLVNVTSGMRLTCHPSFIIDAPAGAAAATVETIDIREMLHAGQIVRWASPKANGRLHVVIKDDYSRDTVTIAALGADGGRIWKIPAARNLTVVDPAEVLKV